MTDMVDRVAGAISEACDYALPPFLLEACAKAAIAAMREPTEGMEKAGDEYGRFTDGPSAFVVWQAMIDEALK